MISQNRRTKPPSYPSGSAPPTLSGDGVAGQGYQSHNGASLPFSFCYAGLLVMSAFAGGLLAWLQR